MAYSLQPQGNYYRRQVLLHLPPGSCFLFHTTNNMSAPLTPPCITHINFFDSEFTSDDVIVVGSVEEKQFVLVGAVTAKRSLTHLTVVTRGRNPYAIKVEQPDIKEGDPPEEVVILEGDDWRQLLKQYADCVAEKMCALSVTPESNLTGYCTWYYYYEDVTEADFLENLDACAAHQNTGYSPRVVQIDDGYQTFQGDWNDQASSWPTPLAEIGRRLKASGMTGGIWTMPFTASTASRVFREHPDWFVKGEDGEPKVALGWSAPPNHLWVTLDTTNPAVQEHLKKIFRTFHEWGFDYFKMDGLGFALTDGIRYDKNATPVSAFREGLKAIRDAVPGAYLLGCCPPMLPCIGYVNGARVSNDTKAAWQDIKDAMVVSLSRWWMFDKLFRADPDTLMARQDRAENTLQEARVSVITGILTGVSLTSDNLSTIAPERFQLLERAAKYRVKDAMPIAWRINQWPLAFAGTLDGKKAVALINHTDAPLDFTFEQLELAADRPVEEILQPLGILKERVSIASHDAMLLVQA